MQSRSSSALCENFTETKGKPQVSSPCLEESRRRTCPGTVMSLVSEWWEFVLICSRRRSCEALSNGASPPYKGCAMYATHTSPTCWGNTRKGANYTRLSTRPNGHQNVYLSPFWLLLLLLLLLWLLLFLIQENLHLFGGKGKPHRVLSVST